MGYRAVGVFACVVFAASCGGELTPVSPSAAAASLPGEGLPEPPGGWVFCGGLVGQRNGRLTADVSGQAYNANYSAAADYLPAMGLLIVFTSDCGVPQRGIGLRASVSGPGAFPLSAPTGFSESGPPTGPMHWRLDNPTGGDAIVLTVLTTTRAIGTFTFVAPADTATGATGTRTVTGEFDIILR